jgi:arylsulfatase A-like enzyme
MTGRQWPRTGLPWVLGPVDSGGLNLNETTIAEHLKLAGYSTAIVGKWHLGARNIYLPANRGFDSYLGIPYSDDMGDAIASACRFDENEIREQGEAAASINGNQYPYFDSERWSEEYDLMGTQEEESNVSDDPAKYHLPLVYQEKNETIVLEQPLDFTVSNGKIGHRLSTMYIVYSSQKLISLPRSRR